MRKENIFSDEFVGEVFQSVESHCSDGECITAQNLAVAVGLDETDHLLISQLVKRQLKERVSVQMGPGGGFHLKGIPVRKKDKKSVREAPDPEFAARVKKELDNYFVDQNRSHCVPSYLAGKMDIDPQRAVRDIANLMKSGVLKGYTTKPGAGIIPVSTVVNDVEQD